MWKGGSLPFTSLYEGVKLLLHLARQRLPTVVRWTPGHYQMTTSGSPGVSILHISEEEGVSPGQLEPGVQYHQQPGGVELATCLDRDEDVILG